MNIILSLILFVNVCTLALLLLFALKARQIYEDFRTFVTPVDEKTGSPAYQTASAISDIFTRSLIATFKSTFMGKQSGEARGETAVNADIAEGLLATANPAISAVLGSFPALKKTLRRNPELLNLALSKLGGLGNAKPVESAPSNGQSKLDPFEV